MSGLGARFDPRKLGLALVAPLMAFAVALLLSSVVLLIAGHAPLQAFSDMYTFGVKPEQLVNTVNKASGYYLAALAVAIGFKMNLFNIGVDGQYRLAAMVAAVAGAAVALPVGLHVLFIVVVAVAVGALWSGIAGLLKVYRGVSEVISTIMLNFIGAAVVAWMNTPDVFAILENNTLKTPDIARSGWMPGFDTSGGQIYGFLTVAALVGFGYWFLLNRTRFGFDLRASGLSEPAAVASGVDVKRMVLTSMLLSGGAAGLVGLPLLLGATHSYGQDFPSGIGFTGIAIALLGRNHPVGMGFAALLWGFLDVSNQILDLNGVPKEIVAIMQGIIVLAVVVAYEIVRRIGQATEQRQVAARVADGVGPAGGAGGGQPGATAGAVA
jgi:general nucleoside transport system permease protein